VTGAAALRCTGVADSGLVEPTAKGVLLWSRAALVAFVALVTGAVGHVSADGLLPSPLVLAGVFTLSVPFCAAQLVRPAGMPRLVLLLSAGQTAVHVVLTLTAGHRGDAVTVTGRRSVEAVLPVQDGRRVGSLLDGYESATHGGPAVEPALPVGSLLGELAAHAPMMAAHLAAAALVGIWLALGERSLWALLALAERVVVGPVLVAVAWLGMPPLVVTAPRPADVPRVRPTHPLLAPTLSRRGPPALLAA
jgi:hypothetical protein